MEVYYREAIKLCASLLIEKDLSLAFAESSTAGRAAMEFSLIEKAGKFLKGGIVCYDNSVKETLLKVDQQVTKYYTPESIEMSRDLVRGLSSLIEADLKVGITGITKSEQSEICEKPIGSMFAYCMLGNALLFEESYFFKGDPEEIIMETIAQIAIDIYINLIALEVTD